jgi:hypothetical protein
MQNNRLASTIIICTLLSSFSVSGQKSLNSPYARFNLGNIETAGSFRNTGMGGIGTGTRDNSTVNFLNPASYSSIDTNSFIFDFGLTYGVNYLSDGSNHYLSGDMNFNHIMLGFPLTKGLGVAAGMVPFSNGYYRISESVTSGDDPLTGGYLAVHTGEGNLSKFFIGGGINIFKYLSAGINMTLIAGNIHRLNEIDFTDYYSMFHTNTTEKIQLSGINLEYGAQVMAPLKNNFFIDAGITISAGKNYHFRSENLIYLYSAYNTIDTLSNIVDPTKAYLPGTLRAGISFGKRNKFIAGFDFSDTKWSKAVISSSGISLSDSRSLRFGAEYIPEKYSNYSLLRRMEYRIGGHLEDTYLLINGEKVKEYGFSLGFGIPMNRSLSKANFYLDYSKKYGAGSSALHNENIFTVGASLNFYDYWFLKRKYD